MSAAASAAAAAAAAAPAGLRLVGLVCEVQPEQMELVVRVEAAPGRDGVAPPHVRQQRVAVVVLGPRARHRGRVLRHDADPQPHGVGVGGVVGGGLLERAPQLRLLLRQLRVGHACVEQPKRLEVAAVQQVEQQQVERRGERRRPEQRLARVDGVQVVARLAQVGQPALVRPMQLARRRLDTQRRWRAGHRRRDADAISAARHVAARRALGDASKPGQRALGLRWRRARRRRRRQLERGHLKARERRRFAAAVAVAVAAAAATSAAAAGRIVGGGGAKDDDGLGRGGEEHRQFAFLRLHQDAVRQAAQQVVEGGGAQVGDEETRVLAAVEAGLVGRRRRRLRHKREAQPRQLDERERERQPRRRPPRLLGGTQLVRQQPQLLGGGGVGGGRPRPRQHV